MLRLNFLSKIINSISLDYTCEKLNLTTNCKDKNVKNIKSPVIRDREEIIFEYS